MSETSSEEPPQLMASEKQCPSIPQTQGDEQGHDLTLDRVFPRTSTLDKLQSALRIEALGTPVKDFPGWVK